MDFEDICFVSNSLILIVGGIAFGVWAFFNFWSNPLQVIAASAAIRVLVR